MQNPTTGNLSPQSPPPQLLPAFVEGFNTTASHIYLIILPVLLDLVLWFGPHLRMKTVFLPIMLETVQQARAASLPQTLEMLDIIEETWKLFLERYNLISSASTFPLGIPSIMTGQAPLLTPLGNAPIIEIATPLQAVLYWLLFLMSGLILGSLYFANLARCFHKNPAEAARFPSTLAVLAWQITQMMLLFMALFIIMLVILLPAMLLTSALVMASPVLAVFVLLGTSFVVIWVMIPLLFTPHGIFSLRQNVAHAALTSARVARLLLPGTSLFLLIALVLYQGLGILWRMAPETSWMALVGILGHAFISTAIVASSFAYYLKCLHWFQTTTQRSTLLREVL